MNRTALLALLFVGCGRAELQAPPAEVVAEPPAVAPACVETEDFTQTRWECGTVSALEVVSVSVTWTGGQPTARAVMRNTTGEFLNYPGVQIDVSEPALRPSHARDALYGLGGCDEAELGMGFSGAVPSGTAVTFTAKPVHINGDDCPLSYPPVSVTVTAP